MATFPPVPLATVQTTKALQEFTDAKQSLASVMSGRYGNGEEFDLALFKALRGCCNTYVLTGNDSKNHSNYIFLHATDDYAIGFVRNNDSTLIHGLAAENSKSSSISSSSTTSAGLSSPADCSRPDHGSWLFEKINGEWKPTDIFSVVELKESKRSCASFPRDDDGSVIGVELKSLHGALGQAILCTIASVLLSRARHGVLHEATTTNSGNDDEKALPLVVLAGNTKSAGVPTTKTHWVRGDVVIPEACCDRYSFRVKSFGKFCSDPVEEMRSTEQALSVYLDTLLFGIRAAILAFRDRLSDHERKPNPISGVALLIGSQALDWQVHATAIRLPFGHQDMNVSQAELFKGKLNVFDYLIPDENCVFFCARNMNVPVIIKASSIAVHRMLIHPDVSFPVLKLASSALWDCPLLAVLRRNAGMITIMDDLSEQGYAILRPESGFSTNLASLWKGFKRLVIAVLVPLAKLGVIHADIRPGFDLTANILYKVVDDGKVQMQLIDYESVVDLMAWNAPPNHGGYLSIGKNKNAMAFVMWQCIAVAYAWLEERCIVRKDGVANRDVADIRHLQQVGNLPTWLPHSCIPYATSKTNDELSVTNILDQLEKVFENRDSRKSAIHDRVRILKELAKMAGDL